MWEFRASCGTHDWRDSHPRPHVSQWPPLPVPQRSALRRPARPLRQTAAAVKKTTGPMKRCRCVKHLFYPLLRDCRPAENRRHVGASINLWPLVETYFPHTPPSLLCEDFYPTSLRFFRLKGRARMQSSDLQRQNGRKLLILVMQSFTVMQRYNALIQYISSISFSILITWCYSNIGCVCGGNS